jgi:hypothetical protein
MPVISFPHYPDHLTHFHFVEKDEVDALREWLDENVSLEHDTDGNLTASNDELTFLIPLDSLLTQKDGRFLTPVIPRHHHFF